LGFIPPLGGGCGFVVAHHRKTSEYYAQRKSEEADRMLVVARVDKVHMMAAIRKVAVA
jgi:hypothetical protein